MFWLVSNLYIDPFQGCVNVKMNTTDIATLSEKTSDIQAYVIVEEASTGEKQVG